MKDETGRSRTLEDQVASSVENNAKTVVANEENTECTTVGEGIQFEIPSVEEEFLETLK